MRKINFAVIGYGHIGRRHVEMINKNVNCELIAICDILPIETLIINKLEVPHYYSLEELFKNHNNIDVVCIATPNGLHCEHALQVLDNYCNVVIEKPMSLTKYDAERIIHKSLQVNKFVFTVMQNRYSPPSKWIKSVIENGLMGKIYLVQLNCFWNRDERYYGKNSWHGLKHLDGGVLFTQFSHFIDIFYWLFGDIRNIKSKYSNFNHSGLTEFDDSGIITFDFGDISSGVLSFSTSVWDSNFESSITIIGECGTVKIGGQYMDEVIYCNIKDYNMPKLEKTNPGNDYGGYKGSAQNHNFVIENVVDVMNNSSKITTNALEGLKIVEIIEKIYSSRN
jgi:UDP-N-acetyl-2-amino-2-deoxyglucuronate dehydrogenase